MASGPITSWEIDGETAETVSDFIFGRKIICFVESNYHLMLFMEGNMASAVEYVSCI